jgi:hypothetical protein
MGTDTDGSLGFSTVRRHDALQESYEYNVVE